MSIYKAIVVALAGFMIIGCTDDAKHDAPMSNKKTLEVNGIITDSNLTSSEKAEKLARGAEELVLGNPAAFMYADEVLNAALNLDANNKRAQLYKVLLGPAMTTKGIVARTRTLQTDKEHNDAMDILRKEQPQSVIDFLTQGPKDITNETQFQSYLDKQIQTYETARQFFKRNKDMKITLYVPATMAIKEIADQTPKKVMYYDSYLGNYVEYEDNFKVKYCDVTKTGFGTIEFTVCTNEQVTERTLEAGDIETLQNKFAALKIAASLSNSYRIAGGFEFARKQQDLGKNRMGADAGYAYLSKTADFATLRNSQAFSTIKAMGADAIKGVRYIMANQNTLCPDKNKASSDSYWHDIVIRPGKLYEYGLCINNDDETNKLLADVERALKGETTKLKWKKYNNFAETKSTDIRPAAMIDNPILDLKDLEPKFNPCGRVVNVSDASLGGLFVNKDANTVLWETQTYCGSKMDEYILENNDRFENVQ